MGTAIGGHEGMTVSRLKSGIEKRADDPHQWRSLVAEYEILIRLVGTGLAPRPLGVAFDQVTESAGATLQEDLGDSQPIEDAASEGGESLRAMWIHWLARLQRTGIRHGDLTPPNMINRPDQVFAIDWAEAHTYDEPAPQKQPWTDRYLMIRSIRDLTGDTPRVARRWMAILEDLDAARHVDGNPYPMAGKRLVDYGTYKGAFPALAALEGMDAIGIDKGGFRTGEDSIALGRIMWHAMGQAEPTLISADILQNVIKADISLVFSTWVYVAKDHGLTAAESWLGNVLRHSGILYFEHQYEGDGPGFWTREETGKMLGGLGGTTQVIASIPVTGRDAVRDVWRVTK